MTKKTPLILSATRMEIEPLLKGSSVLNEELSPSGRGLFSCQSRDCPFDILVTGPGVFNACQAAAEHLCRHRPALILQTGIAGIFPESGLDIGDIGIAESECYIHFGVESTTGLPSPLPFDLIDAHPLTRQGLFPTDPALTEGILGLLKHRLPKQASSLSAGPFVTVSTITATRKTADRINNTHHPLMESMEGAASAHVACCHSLPFIEVRSGSNRVGDRDKATWNIPLAVQRACLALRIIIEQGSDLWTNR